MMDDLLKQLATGGPTAGWVVACLFLLGFLFTVRLLLKKQDEVLDVHEKRLVDHKDFFLAQSEIVRRYLESAAETSKATLEALRDRRRD